MANFIFLISNLFVFTLSVILFFYPPKMNAFIGYRTPTAYKSPELWNAGQKISSRLLFQASVINIFIWALLYLFFEKKENSLVFNINLSVLLLTIFGSLILTEIKLKRIVGNKENLTKKPNSYSRYFKFGFLTATIIALGMNIYLLYNPPAQMGNFGYRMPTAYKSQALWETAQQIAPKVGIITWSIALLLWVAVFQILSKRAKNNTNDSTRKNYLFEIYITVFLCCILTSTLGTEIILRYME